MNTLKWLFPPRNTQKRDVAEPDDVNKPHQVREVGNSNRKIEPKQVYEAMTGADLVNIIRDEHERVEKLEEQLNFAKLTMGMQSSALEKALKDIENHKVTFATQEKRLATHDQTIERILAENANRKQQVQQLQSAAKRGKKERQDLEQKIAISNAKHTKAEASHSQAMRTLQQTFDQTSKSLHDAQEINHELRFDLELLRCTPKTEECDQISDSAFPAPPFVLVLVDGDAYSWAACNFEKHISSPGAHVAQEIRNEVQKYLLANKERIPVHSRIVTRVFANFGGSAAPTGAKRTKNSVYVMPTFAKQLTESTPLFDFSDAGGGKERVDEKIKENFHLFISNSSCHTIFFAAAKDNGFARLLEQYACNASAKSKVVLVYPGYVARELAPLGYATIEWPRVFKTQSMSIPEIRAAEKQQQKAENAKNAFTAGIACVYGERIALPALENVSVGIRYLGKVRNEGEGMDDMAAEVSGEVD